MCMTSNCSTHTSYGDADHVPFEPAYEVMPVRILRGRMGRLEGGVAEVTFRGQVTDGVYAGERCVYAEVAVDETTATTVRVAVVPAGKRVPLDESGAAATRIGMSGDRHVYLLGIDRLADRAAYDAALAARRSGDALV